MPLGTTMLQRVSSLCRLGAVQVSSHALRELQQLLDFPRSGNQQVIDTICFAACDQSNVFVPVPFVFAHLRGQGSHTWLVAANCQSCVDRTSQCGQHTSFCARLGAFPRTEKVKMARCLSEWQAEHPRLATFRLTDLHGRMVVLLTLVLVRATG